MTSTLSIKLNLNGGLSDQNVSFDPTMIDINAKKSKDSVNRENVIYFPPTIKIRKQEVLNVGSGISPIQVFTSPAYTSKLLQQYSKMRGYKPLSIKQAEEKGIIRDNFEYFLNVLFPKNGKILINNIAYTIISAKIASTKIPSDAKKGNKITFKMDVNLRIIRKDKDTMVNRKRQSCKNQRKEINTTLNELGWHDIGFDERPEDKPKKISDTKLGPLYTSSNTGIATGRMEKSRDPKKRYYNPYGYPIAYAQPMSRSSSNPKNIQSAVPMPQSYINPYGPYGSFSMPQKKPPTKAGGGRTRKRTGNKKSRATCRVHFV